VGRDSCTYCTSSLAEGLRNIRKTTARVTRCRVAFSKPGLYKCEIGVPPLRLRKYSIFFILRRDARRTFMLKFQCHWHFVYVGISMPLTLYVEISMPLTLRLCWNFNATEFVYVEISMPLTVCLCWNFNATDTSFMLKFQCHWHFELEQCVWLWSCLVLDRSFEVRTVLVMLTCPLCHMLSVIRDTE